MKKTNLLLLAATILVMSGCSNQEKLSMTTKNVNGATTASMTAGDGAMRHAQAGDMQSAGHLTMASQNMAKAAGYASYAAPIYARRIAEEAR